MDSNTWKICAEQIFRRNGYTIVDWESGKRKHLIRFAQIVGSDPDGNPIPEKELIHEIYLNENETLANETVFDLDPENVFCMLSKLDLETVEKPKSESEKTDFERIEIWTRLDLKNAIRETERLELSVVFEEVPYTEMPAVETFTLSGFQYRIPGVYLFAKKELAEAFIRKKEIEQVEFLIDLIINETDPKARKLSIDAEALRLAYNRVVKQNGGTPSEVEPTKQEFETSLRIHEMAEFGSRSILAARIFHDCSDPKSGLYTQTTHWNIVPLETAIGYWIHRDPTEIEAAYTSFEQDTIITQL